MRHGSCPQDEVEAIVTKDEPYSADSWFLAKGIGAIELCKLGELLKLASYADLKSGFKLVGEPLEDGPWPETTHPTLIAKLRGISDAEIQSVVRDWSKTEELAGAAPAALADYLLRLRNFLQHQTHPIFLVNAL